MRVGPWSSVFVMMSKMIVALLSRSMVLGMPITTAHLIAKELR
jgi:hypothetical protein